jgi:hypothetical protein
VPGGEELGVVLATTPLHSLLADHALTADFAADCWIHTLNAGDRSGQTVNKDAKF